jgi:hypothetical protein
MTRMRISEIGAWIAAVVLLLFDATLAAQMYFHGWLKTATWTNTKEGERAVQMTNAPLTFTDWSMIFGLALLHLSVIYGFWTFTRRRRRDMGRQSWLPRPDIRE